MAKKSQNIRKLSRIGPRSLGVILPAEFIAELKWREKQKLVVKRTRGGIVIRDWKPAKAKKK